MRQLSSIRSPGYYCPKQSFCQVSNCNLKHRKHSTFLHPKREQPERPEHQSSPSTSGTSSNEPNVRAQNRGKGAPSIGLAVVLACEQALCLGEKIARIGKGKGSESL